MKAVILAAGIGRRLNPLTLRIPKALIRIGQKSLLQRQIEMLEEEGFGKSDIIVVTGYLSYKIKELFSNRVTIIYNEAYKTTNNIYSLFLASKHLRNGFLLFNSDIIFEKQILKNLLDSKETVLVVDDFKPLDEEDMKVVAEGDRIVKISKEIPLDKATGEYIGAMKVLSSESEIFLQEIERFIKEGITNVWYENALNNVLNQATFKYISTDSRKWAEIDTHDDLKFAEQLFYCFEKS